MAPVGNSADLSKSKTPKIYRNRIQKPSEKGKIKVTRWVGDTN